MGWAKSLGRGVLAFVTIIDHSDRKLIWAIALSVTTILSFVASFSIGMGPIAWVYSSEVLPLKLRAQGAGIGVAVNRTTSGVISMTFLSLTRAITTGGAFFLFAGIATVAFVFFYTFLPETQGKSLEEMDALFNDFKWKSSMRRRSSKEDVYGNGNGNTNGRIQLEAT